MKLRKIMAVAYKQMLDTAALKSIAVQFLLYPVLLLIFTAGREEGSRISLVSILVSLFIGSSPMLTVNSIIREDKHSGALRAMMLASVHPSEYMVGISLFMLGISALTATLIGLAGKLPIGMLPLFVLAMALGSVLTILLGCAASLRTANQSNAVLFISAFSLVNGMIPVLEIMHPSLRAVTRFWYTQQIKDMTVQLYSGCRDTMLVGFIVIGINLLVVLAALFFTYRKSRLFES